MHFTIGAASNISTPVNLNNFMGGVVVAKFRVFNIQLLANEDGIKDVGVSGYRKLFSELKKLNSQHLRESTHTSYHYQISGDSFFGPKEFHFPAGYVYGNFVRYTKADQITELRTGKTLYRASRSGKGVVGVNLISFAFDTERHLLAIDGAHLPKSEFVIEALIRFLEPIQNQFPDHELKVNLVSRRNAIEKVFQEAVAYKTVELTLSFRNGPASDDLLQELKDSKTHQVNVKASAGPQGQMSKVPEFIKGLLRAASSLGWSRVSYFVPADSGGLGVTKKATFDSREAPLTFSARHSAADESDETFFARVATKLDELDIDSENPVESESSENQDEAQ